MNEDEAVERSKRIKQFDDVLYSGIDTLDKLRFKIAASDAQRFSVTIEDLDKIRSETMATQPKDVVDPEITVINEYGDIESGPAIDGLKRDPGC